MVANSPKSRRWRLLSTYGSTGASASYELPCKVSDRVAIVHTNGTWGIWGWPAPQGVPIEGGKAKGRYQDDAFRAAKPIARAALDAIAVKISQGDFPRVAAKEQN